MTSKQRSVKRQLFPDKLWDLVNRPASGVQWSSDGKNIEVDRAQLENSIGTKFRSQNFDSFIRQLHFYGFRKSGNSYHHEKFQRGQPEALQTMKRKYSSMALPPSLNQHVNSRQHSPYHMSNTSNTSSDDSTISYHSTNLPNNSAARDPMSHADIHDEVIDLSGSVTINKTSLIPRSSSSETDITESPIDFSKTRRYLSYNSPSKSTKSYNCKLKEVTSRYTKDTQKEIVLYSMRASVDKKQQTTGQITDNLILENVCENIACAYDNTNSIEIAIPDIMKDPNSKAWPKTLVFGNFLNGTQKILSAYFIY